MLQHRPRNGSVHDSADNIFTVWLFPRSRFVALLISFGAVLVTSATAFAQRDLKDMPAPDPVAEMAAMRVAPEAQVNLFAADPVIPKPVQ